MLNKSTVVGLQSKKKPETSAIANLVGWVEWLKLLDNNSQLIVHETQHLAMCDLMMGLLQVSRRHSRP
ncbi:MAG: hypothetical protein F6J96_25220 [Symploca sp. SIO1C2]|nr:hypothetical protein [Symploca sp. SIO1C2]